KKVRKWLELEVGDYVDDAILSIQTNKVLDEYRKRYYSNVKITWQIDINETNGFAVVQVAVSEGQRASLRKVDFEGNTYLPPSRWKRFVAAFKHEQALSEKSVPPEDLAAAVRQHIWHIFSFITKRGIYNPDDLEADRMALRALYQNRGYLDARIGEPEVSFYAQRKLKAVFPISEGSQYRIGDISIRGATLFAESNLWRVVAIKSGDIAAPDAINRSAEALSGYYQSRGYIRTTVRPQINPRRNDPIVDIQFDISESSLIHIRYVDIRGNTRTKDIVIRRELQAYPGEVYNQVQVKRGERILQNLGFFSRVTSYPRETIDPTKDDLVYEVEEGRTGQFNIGAGYSSIDELMGFVEMSQGNFDLFNWPHFTGDGQKLRLRTQFGKQREDYELSFVEPWFLGRKLSLGVDFYDTKRNNLSDYYSQQTLGSAVTLGKPLDWPFFKRINLRYSLERVTIFDVATNATEMIQNEEGSRNVSTLKPTIIHDTRNSPFTPTRGNKTTLSARLSGGPLGFDTDVYGLEAETTSYWPMIFDHVLSLKIWAATVKEYGNDDDVPLFDRLFLGGARNLRGFKYRYVGPYQNDDPIGGKTAGLGSLEYTIPIYPNLIRVAGFYDIGNVWLDAFDFDVLKYCSDIGIGLRLDVPGFPIRLDYAWPLEISGDVQRTSARFNFWLGYGF
ncbi:MAG: outer membrane protein assembly factor BamA, partial [Kiritimatiellia bacterium]|nr:outer membrane protein assembly factor BamA [Kiritimatiellia bacterium]